MKLILLKERDEYPYYTRNETPKPMDTHVGILSMFFSFKGIALFFIYFLGCR